MSKFVHYSRYTGEDLGIGAEDLLQALASLVSIQALPAARKLDSARSTSAVQSTRR